MSKHICSLLCCVLHITDFLRSVWFSFIHLLSILHCWSVYATHFSMFKYVWYHVSIKKRSFYNYGFDKYRKLSCWFSGSRTLKFLFISQVLIVWVIFPDHRFSRLSDRPSLVLFFFCLFSKTKKVSFIKIRRNIHTFRRALRVFDNERIKARNIVWYKLNYHEVFNAEH